MYAPLRSHQGKDISFGSVSTYIPVVTLSTGPIAARPAVNRSIAPALADRWQPTFSHVCTHTLHRKTRPSDDLQSAVFVFLDLLLGRLPWFEEAKAKDKARVLELKQQVRLCRSLV